MGEISWLIVGVAIGVSGLLVGLLTLFCVRLWRRPPGPITVNGMSYAWRSKHNYKRDQDDWWNWKG